jgi:copper(I)-binding protein
MKKRELIPFIMLVILLAACSPSEARIQTAVAQTQSAWTQVPTQTPYPTYTPQPTIVITRIVTETYTPTPVFTATPTIPASMITVDGGWGHITRNPTIAAFYMLIHNTGEGDDRLNGASGPACGHFTLQQMGYPDTDKLPVSVSIPAKSVVALQMGEFNYRLLCYAVSGVGVGSTMPLILYFEKFGAVKVAIQIKETPSG